MSDPVGTEKAIAQAVELIAQNLAQGRTAAQVRAQMLAFEAYNAQTGDEYRAVWYAAKAAGLMNEQIRLDYATGPLGEYLAHKGKLLKEREAASEHPAEYSGPPSPAAVADHLNL